MEDRLETIPEICRDCDHLEVMNDYYEKCDGEIVDFTNYRCGKTKIWLEVVDIEKFKCGYKLVVKSSLPEGEDTI